MSMGAMEEAECGSCGKIIDANAASCPHCGASFEDEQMMGECGNCGQLISIDANSCEHCGAVFEDDVVAEEVGECGNCGAEIALDANSCSSCGAQFVEAAPEPEPVVRQAPVVPPQVQIDQVVEEPKPVVSDAVTTSSAVAVVSVNPMNLLIGGALALIAFIFLVLILWNATAGFPFSSGNDPTNPDSNAKLNWLSVVGAEEYGWSPLGFSLQDIIGLVLMLALGGGGAFILFKELGKQDSPAEAMTPAVSTTPSVAPAQPQLVPTPSTTPISISPSAGPSVEMAECPACNKDIPEDATECPHCGVEFADEEVAECPACNKQIPMEATSCPYCGVEFED